MTADVDIVGLFADRHEPDSRRQLVEHFDGLAAHLSRRFSGRGHSADDLLQVARLGLLNAIDRFDVNLGFQFSTFATRTILGELKRYRRDHSWAVRVPRSLQERWLEVSRAVEDLQHDLGRSPTIDEIAATISAEPEEVLEALDAGGAHSADSLDAPAGEEGGASVGDLLGDDDPSIEWAGPWSEVKERLGELPEREQKIIYLRFFEDKTQTEIAEIVGMSQMHVSRLLRQGLESLR